MPHPLPPFAHPLDPLSPAEVALAVQILREQRAVGSQFRFATVVLQEPPKSLVQAFQAGQASERQAFLILLDNATGSTYEAVVSLTQQAVTSWQNIPGVQPNIMADELAECEQAVKADAHFREKLQERGIHDLDLVMVDPWAVGNFGLAEEVGIRLARALCWLRHSPGSNGYARPIEGLIPVVDLNRMQVIRIEDYGVVPIPPEAGNYAAAFMPQFREDLKPLHIVQPQGPSFRVEGYQVSWQRWQFRVGFTPREGLVLHTISYQDQGRQRPIIYRASIAEMVVPYGDPRPQHFRKNAFDVGEHGIGALANSLKLGCDCLGDITYFDAVMTDSRGDLSIIPQAICLHEEDAGLLWKHTDWRNHHTEVRRSRRLVISFITTVDNYEYGFYWYFYQDGSLQLEVKLTGILLPAAALPAEDPLYGSLVAPQLNALVHQHFFCARLDMQVDGNENSLYEVNTVAAPAGAANPYGNAFLAQSTLLPSEQSAQRLVDPLSCRYWKVVNPHVHNRLGQAVAYKLVPGENALPFAQPDAPILKRAAFMTRHLWATPYHPDQRYPSGDYPNQHPGGAGIPEWSAANRSLESTNLVLWYSFGHHHIPRPEDWPIMPVASLGFMLKPVGFFDANPSLDVPPSACQPGS
ncbi:MAG: primary-amine oxidase [Cyanobacteriota bacterium]|nr:primary-amine oxidase [Cyanobacteriota bacterium]